MKVMNNDRLKLDAYAWPGGYPIVYLARDGWREDDGQLDFNDHNESENICCHECAVNVKEWPDLIIIAHYLHMEGQPEICEYCNGFTESAYGEVETEMEG